MRTTAMAASIAALGLMSCTPGTSELSPETQTQLNQALAYICPFVPALKPQIPASNGSAHAALVIAELSCPPNEPPTNVIKALAMIATVVVLRPWITRDAPQIQRETWPP